MRDKANKIIIELIYGTNIKRFLSKIRPTDIQDDLQAELGLILLEKPPSFIIKLNENNQLSFYAIKIIKILAFSNTSYFFKTFRSTTLEITDYMHDIIPNDNSQIDELEYKAEMHNKIKNELDKIHWYYAKMINFYIEFGDYRNMSKELDIPHSSCFKDVKKGINQIKQQLNDKPSKIK